MPNELTLNPYEDSGENGPVSRLGNTEITVTTKKDGSLSVALPGIGTVVSLRFDLTDPLPPDGRKRNRARLLGFAPFLQIKDTIDKRAAIFERNISGKGGGISFAFLPEPGTEIVLFPREVLYSAFFAIRRNGETVLYAHIRGGCGVDSKEYRLYFPYPRAKIRLFASPLCAVGRMITAPITPPENKGFVFPDGCLPDGLRERAVSVLERENEAFLALKTQCGFYRTSEGRLSLRDQECVLLFFLAVGEREKAEAIFEAVDRAFRTNRFLSPFFDPEIGVGAPDKRYPETDAALAVTEIFLALAEEGDPKELFDRFGDLLLTAVTVLRDGVKNFRLPYAGHEPELSGLPFLTRFHASARATASFIRSMKALALLFPEEKKITAAAGLAEEAEKHFSGFFLGEHGYYEDSILPVTRSMPSYLYGTCQFCGLRGRETGESWLIRKNGWYRCEVCYADRFEPGLPKKPNDPAPRLGKTLPAFLAANGFADEETLRGEKALTKRVSALDLTDAALLLLAEGKITVPLVVRILDAICEKQKIAELSDAALGPRAFAAAALLRTANRKTKE